jgi:hypothetical protein
MKTIMKLEQLTSIGVIRQFLEGTQAVAFNVATSKQERYLWVQKALLKHQYRKLNKPDKGILTRYLMKVTGYSRSQIKRLIQQYLKTSQVMVSTAHRNGFKCRYSKTDIRLLAEMDERHQ